jgi:hypothetical protein
MLSTIYSNNELSIELTEFLKELKPEVDNYTNAKAQALHSRMLIIGRINDYKNEFPQRSADHRLLRQAMNSEWSRDVIEKAITAYNQYNKLLATEVSEFVSLAKNANPSQLVTLSRGEGTSLAYDAAMYLKKTGALPSQAKMEQHLRGYLNKDFSSRRTAVTQTTTSTAALQSSSSRTADTHQTEETVTVSVPVVPDYSYKQKVLQDMVDNEADYPLIRTRGAAECFTTGGRKDKLAAAAQVLLNIKYHDDELDRIISIVQHLAQEALKKPHYIAPALHELS